MIEKKIPGQRRPQIKDDRDNVSQERLDDMAANIKLVSASVSGVMDRLANSQYEVDYHTAFDIAYEALYQTVKERHYETRPDWRENYTFINHYNLKLTDQIGIFARKRHKESSYTKPIETYNLEFAFGFVYDIDLEIDIENILKTYSRRQEFIIRMILNNDFIKDIKKEFKEHFDENLKSEDIKITRELFQEDMGRIN